MMKKLRRIDIFNLVLLFIALITYSVSPSNFKFFLWLFVIFTGVRILLILKRKILWKTRNRLIFSGLFFVITPIFFLISLFLLISGIIMGQYGITIIDNTMNLQLQSLDGFAKSSIEKYSKLDEPEKTIKRELSWMKYYSKKKKRSKRNRMILCYFKKIDNGDLEIIGKTDKNFNAERVVRRNDLNGYFLLDKELYFGVIQENEKLLVISAIKLTQNFFTEYISKISNYIIEFRIPGNSKNSISKALLNERQVDIGGAVNIFPYSYDYINFDVGDVGADSKSSFIIQLRVKEMYNKLKNSSSKNDNGIFTVIYVFIAIFGFFIIISFLIGFKIIRVITKAINQLTKGTHKIRNGDFSFRIKLKSKDQLQYLAESFNEMASGINRLLIEEKEKHRLEEELRIARTIQEKLLPDESFESKEFEISAVNIPAEEIAGDYFDYNYEPDNYLMMIIADVSGKGASAAFYMAELKGLNNHLRKTDISPAKLTAEFHKSLFDTFDKVTFITMSIAKFNIKENEILFSRAGHTKGLFYNSEQDEIIELFPSGFAVGMPNFSEDKIEEIKIKYSSGDIMILFSDGLSEIMNKENEMFELMRIKTILKKSADKSAGEIKEIILSESEKFSDNIPNQDDLTLIVLKVK